MKKPFFIFLILSALILSSCSTTMSEVDCLDTDWKILGYEDGVQGIDNTNVSTIHPDCTSLGISPDLNAYLTGHEEGLELYCQESNGLLEARNGSPYLGVCPAHLEPGFLLGFSNGQQIYVAETEKDKISHQIKLIEEELEEFNSSIDAINRSAGSPIFLTFVGILKESEERVVILENQIFTLQQEQAKIEQRISRLETETKFVVEGIRVK